MRLLAVVGLEMEARIARRAGMRVIVGGGTAQGAQALLARCPADVDCLVSIGIAGGLSPDMSTGDVVLAGDLSAEAGSWRASAAWRERLIILAAEAGARFGPAFGGTRILATPAEKAAAFSRSQALTVDLESEAVARLAEERGIPFLILRAVADDAGRDLPPAALIPLRDGGRPDLRRILPAIARNPGQIPGLLALGRATRQALDALIGPARILQDRLRMG